MASNKKIGNQTGAVNLPTAASAPGVWTNSETSRFLALNQWPRPLEGVVSTAGDYLFAATSGVRAAALTESFYLEAYGATYPKASYSNLSSRIGTNYGGDTLNFAVPNVSEYFSYFKATVGASGVHSSGVLPTHTHNVSLTGYGGTSTNVGSSINTSKSSSTVYTSVDGEEHNNGKSKEILPLIAYEDAGCVTGTVVQFMLPTAISSLAALLPEGILICSGQEISRTAYDVLYSRMGDLYGNGDGSTTFTLPDYRGVFLHAPQTGPEKEVLPYITGSGHQSDSFRKHRHGIGVVTDQSQNWNSVPISANDPNYMTSPASSNSNIGSSVESRPRNIYCLTCIVASGGL